MRIVQVNKFFYLKGGSEAYLFSLRDGLQNAGIESAEFAMTSPKNLPSDWARFFTEEVDYNTTSFAEKIRFAGKIIYSFEARKKIGALLDAFNPDIVHLHIFQHQLSASILPEIKKRNIPVVYTAHDLKSICPNYKMLSRGRICERCRGHRYYHCLTSRCVKGSYLKSGINMVEMYFHLWMKYYDLIDLIITPSRFYREKLVTFRFPADRVVHVPNFVDEDRFAPHYQHGDSFVYLGRLSEEKGILTLVRAMKKVPAGKLVIIGSGPLEARVREEIAGAGLNNIELVGRQSGTRLRRYLQNTMFSIIPSEWYENGPISLLEAFACGKPVIGADIGGIPEHIDDQVNGLIFRPGDPADLAEKINMLLQRPDRIITMGKAARRTAEKTYGRRRHLEAVLRIYNRLLHGNQSDAGSA